MPKTTDNRIWTVAQVNRELRILIDRNMRSIWLEAELTDVKIHQSGHVYLKLKDADSQIPAVFFDGAAQARRMRMANGMAVELYGRVRVYEPQGQYQFYIEQVRPAGMGDLQRRFLELKEKLEKEGLFAPEHKKEIPELPTCVGVITSASGAALRDFLNVVERRFANMHIRIVDSRMQGAESAMQVIRAIRYLNRTRACDVIVVTRGGGSMEDLWCFNDEQLVRQVAQSQIPIISAIGHEVDFTLCDFAADMRAPTPSAAAELVVGRRSVYLDRLKSLRMRLNQALDLRSNRSQQRLERASMRLQRGVAEYLGIARQRVDSCAKHYLFRQPELLLTAYRQRLADAAEALDDGTEQRLADTRTRLDRAVTGFRLLSPGKQLPHRHERLRALETRMVAAARRSIERSGERLQRAEGQLRTLGPNQVLSRGYSILLKDGKALRSTSDVDMGDRIKAMVQSGELDLEVRGKGE